MVLRIVLVEFCGRLRPGQFDKVVPGSLVIFGLYLP